MTVLEQFNAAEQAVKSANDALNALRTLLGLHAPTSNGEQPTPYKAGAPVWLNDPAKVARARAKFRRTMKARARARAAQTQEPTPTTAS
jgi:hypothetical protein